VRAVQVKIFLPEFVFRLRVWILLRYRRLRYGYAFRKIPLTQGKYAIVDPEDYGELAKYKWHTGRSERGLYAVRAVKARRRKTGQKTVSMHWVILKPPKGKFVDHINPNGLDNRRANLRAVTAQQNMWNMRKRKGNCSSKYKGVSWSKSESKWRAMITYNNRWIFIGYFDDEKAAAMAYDARAKELFGDYAAPNLPSSKKRGGVSALSR
jgi:hypothetical protein